MRVEFTPAARDDILSQVRYYALEAGVPDTGLQFVDAVECTVNRIVEMPEAGVLCHFGDDRLRDLRARAVVRFDSMRVYYRIERATILVIRVLHDRRDTAAVLAESDAPP